MNKSIVAALAFTAVILFAPSGAFAQGAGAGGGPAPVIATGGSHHSPLPWIVMGCVSGTVLSAMVANWRDDRELTWSEAASCGILFWFAQPVRVRKVRRAVR
jgi:hypothetical protein